MGNYSELLKDPRWQKKRLEIMSRDNFTCQRCGDEKSTLNVHHFKYGGDPWEADGKYLITLCEGCHADEETMKSGFPVSIKKISESTCVLFADFSELIIQAFEYSDAHPELTRRQAFLKVIEGVKAMRNG